MRIRILTILTLLSVTLMARVPEQGKHVYRASTPEVTYIGRVVRDSAHVSFDWSGTYLRIAFYGRLLKIDYADTGSNWYNLWIDRPMTEKPDRVFRLSTLDEGETMGVYTLFRGEEYADHQIILQKRTEGEQGRLTLYAFQVDGMLRQAEPVRERFIEFIGDSYTCGYGIDAASSKEHFKPRTENAGRTYAALIAQYFGADYMAIAHSGMGLVRNYNSHFANTSMPKLYLQAFDWDTVSSPLWVPDSIQRRPDITVIYLGGNDFSCGMQPSYKRFREGYMYLLCQIKNNYGDRHTILCVTKPGCDDLSDYVERVVSECDMQRVYHFAHAEKVYDMKNDMGADWHPNEVGHLKLAYSLIPYISTLTGWEMRPLFLVDN